MGSLYKIIDRGVPLWNYDRVLPILDKTGSPVSKGLGFDVSRGTDDFLNNSTSTYKTKNITTDSKAFQKWKSSDLPLEPDWGISPTAIFSTIGIGALVKMVGDVLVDKTKPVYEKLAFIDDSKAPILPTPEKHVIAPTKPLPLTVTKPLSPLQSIYTLDNSPSLLMGTMQSAEMISTSIGSLCQIISDTHIEHMSVLASKQQNDFIASQELSKNLDALNVILSAIAQISAELITPLTEVAQAVLNIPQTNVNFSAPPPDNTGLVNAMTPISEWAVSAKAREDFLQTPRNHSDSDGDIIHGGSPMEVKADKDAQHHKLLDDQNTIKIDNDDFNPMSLLGLPLIPFVGREVVFDKNTNHDMNPYGLFHEVL